MNIAVIPARGGSKRIPRKNILRFGGKPLMNWTIEAAIYSNIFDRIIVSTDDWEIAGIAEDAGAEVPFTRDENLSGDYVPSSQVTIDAVTKVGGDIVCQLLPTCPFRTHTDIISAYDQFKGWGGPAQISITTWSWQNPQWSVDRNAHKVFEGEFGRSQDLPELFSPSGAVWFADATSLILNKSFYMRGVTGFMMDWINALDIDTPEDLELAKIIMRGR